MTPHPTHPLIAAYLEELERLLGGTDPGERAEVMSGVREHLDSALGSGVRVGDDEVRDALAELGPPQLVADEAYAGHRPTTAVAPAGVSVLARPWVPVVVAVLTAIGLLLTILVVTSIGGVESSSSSSGDGTGVTTETRTPEELTGSPLLGSFSALMVTLPLWATVAVLVGLSPLWVRREKLIAALLIPAAALLMGLLPQIGWWIIGINGVYAGAWTALVLVLAGGAWILVRSTRQAAARAPRPASYADIAARR
jgi:hypothetical protein